MAQWASHGPRNRHCLRRISPVPGNYNINTSSSLYIMQDIFTPFGEFGSPDPRDRAILGVHNLAGNDMSKFSTSRNPDFRSRPNCHPQFGPDRGDPTRRGGCARASALAEMVSPKLHLSGPGVTGCGHHTVRLVVALRLHGRTAAPSVLRPGHGPHPLGGFR